VRHGKLFSIELHGAIELLVGVALICLPFLVGLVPGATFASIVIGVILVGLALGAAEPGGRASVPLTAHAVYDWGLGMALVGAGIAFGIVQGYLALVFFFAAGAIELGLVAATSYSVRRA
jgi:hypothetical protein